MRQLLGLSILLFLQNSCTNNIDTAQCKILHNGHFYYTVSANGKAQKFDVFRNDSIQIEVASHSKDTSIYNIQWQDDCNYSLILQSVNFNFDQQKIAEAKKFPLLTNIKFIGSNYYAFNSMRSATRFIYNDTMYISR